MDTKVVGLYLVLAYSINAHELPFPTYLNQNPKFDTEGNEIRFGDMILDDDQLDLFFGPLASERKAISVEKYWWPNAVLQYKLDANDSKDINWVDLVRDGIKHWQRDSCVRFEEVDDSFVNKTFVLFQRLNGCYSRVGYNPDLRGAQRISIGYGCDPSGRVAHEIGHALGFLHEQERPDRDTFITVQEKNIMKDNYGDFQLFKYVNNFGLPYDFDSVMHYPNNAFSSNGRYTIVTKDPFNHFRIGQRVGLSFYDKKLANVMYKCSEKCTSPPKCLNEGYVDHHCKCVCPPGLTGSTCQNGKRTVNLRLSCGFEIKKKTKISVPKNFPPNTHCVWVIIAPDDKKIEIRFNTFHINEKSKSYHDCVYDHLELRKGDSPDGERYCGKELNKKKITCDSKKVVLVFSGENTYPGFDADVDFI